MDLVLKIIFQVYLWINVFSLTIFLTMDVININSKIFKSKTIIMDNNLKKRKHTIIRIKTYLKQLARLKGKDNSSEIHIKIKETEKLIDDLIIELSKIDFIINNIEEDFYEINLYRIYNLITCILPIIHIKYLVYGIFDLVEITKKITN